LRGVPSSNDEESCFPGLRVAASGGYAWLLPPSAILWYRNRVERLALTYSPWLSRNCFALNLPPRWWRPLNGPCKNTVEMVAVEILYGGCTELWLLFSSFSTRAGISGHQTRATMPVSNSRTVRQH